MLAAALKAEVSSLRPQLLAATDTVEGLEEELRERVLQVNFFSSSSNKSGQI